MTQENDLIKERMKKLEAAKALGVDPFGGRFDKQSSVQALVDGFEEHKKVRTAGRLTAMRTMGKTVFADLKDETGRVQLFLKPSELPEAQQKLFDCLDLGDILGVEGELFKTKTGEISIRVAPFEL